MAVLMIIGLAVSLLTISVGDGNRAQKIKQQSRALYKSIELAIEDAAFSRQEIGLRFDAHLDEGYSDQYEYQWMVFNHDERLWYVLSSEDLKKTVLLPNLTLNINVEDTQLIIGGKKNEESLFALADVSDENKRIEPDIYFLSSGEMPNFTIEISDKDNSDAIYKIRGNFIGQLRYFLPGQEDDGE